MAYSKRQMEMAHAPKLACQTITAEPLDISS